MLDNMYLVLVVISIRNNVQCCQYSGILIVLLGVDDPGPLTPVPPAPSDPGLLSPMSPSSVPESPGSASLVSSENSRSPYASLATTFTGMSGHHTCPHNINTCPLILITRPCLY